MSACPRLSPHPLCSLETVDTEHPRGGGGANGWLAALQGPGPVALSLGKAAFTVSL